MRVLSIIVVLLSLTACETTKGAGRDLQKAGGTISHTARDAQKSL